MSNIPSPLQVYEQLIVLKDSPEEFEKAKNKIIDDYLDTLPQEQIIKFQKFQQGLDDEMAMISDPLKRAEQMLVAFTRSTGDKLSADLELIKLQIKELVWNRQQ